MGLESRAQRGKVAKHFQNFPYLFSIIALLVMMVTIVLNIILRMAIDHPILGTVEIAKMTGLIVISFCIPYAQWKRANVYVDYLFSKLSLKAKNVISFFSYLFIIGLGILIFYALSVDFIISYQSGEQSEILNWPLFPFKAVWALSWLSLVVVGILQVLAKKKG